MPDYLDLPNPLHDITRQLRDYAVRKTKERIQQAGEALIYKATQPIRDGVNTVKRGAAAADNAFGAATAGVCSVPALVLSENDWAGRAILERYLRGQGDWNITDDPKWTDYMKASDLVRTQVNDKLAEQITPTVAKLKPGDKSVINLTFHANLENGEGIVGYQYLHGTNKTAGDFVLRAALHVIHISTGGNIEFSAILRQTWNDLIDPNPIYLTDRIKNAYAESCTLGRAAPYRISITWNDNRSVIWEAKLGVLRSK